jgi:hypothetical protein
MVGLRRLAVYKNRERGRELHYNYVYRYIVTVQTNTFTHIFLEQLLQLK